MSRSLNRFSTQKMQKTPVSVKYTLCFEYQDVLSGMPKNSLTAIRPAKPKIDCVTKTVRFGTRSYKKVVTIVIYQLLQKNIQNFIKKLKSIIKMKISDHNEAPLFNKNVANFCTLPINKIV